MYSTWGDIVAYEGQHAAVVKLSPGKTAGDE